MNDELEERLSCGCVLGQDFFEDAAGCVDVGLGDAADGGEEAHAGGVAAAEEGDYAGVEAVGEEFFDGGFGAVEGGEGDHDAAAVGAFEPSGVCGGDALEVGHEAFSYLHDA